MLSLVRRLSGLQGEITNRVQKRVDQWPARYRPRRLVHFLQNRLDPLMNLLLAPAPSLDVLFKLPGIQPELEVVQHLRRAARDRYRIIRVRRAAFLVAHPAFDALDELRRIGASFPKR